MAANASTVLVIDDEAPIRSLVQRMLEPAHCRVVQADDAEAGLRLIENVVRRLPTPIRKIIGDLSNKEKVLVGLDIKPLL